MCFLVSGPNICNGKDNLIAEPIKASHISFLNLVQQKWHTWGFGVLVAFVSDNCLLSVSNGFSAKSFFFDWETNKFMFLPFIHEE